MVNIFYNSVDAFNPQVTPFVGIDYVQLYNNESWAKQEVITLEGQLTGCTYALIVAAQSDLLSKFSKCYQSFIIKQNGSTIFSRPVVEIDSISFPLQNWLGILPYTITLKNYPEEYFSGVYGILNPSDNWDYIEQQNEVLEATHTISCQGLNTSAGTNNALNNAQSWAISRTGVSSWATPFLIQNVNPTYFFLVNENETINRFGGTYSLTQKYSSDLTRAGYGVVRYSTSYESGKDNNLITVGLQGEVRGSALEIDSLRQTLNTFSPYYVAVNGYKDIFNRTDLNPTPVNYNIEEQPYQGVITFNYQYNNDNNDNVFFDYDVTINSGDGPVQVSLAGTILAKQGDIASRISKVNAYVSGLSFYNTVLPFYNGLNQLAPLNPNPITYSYEVNNFDAVATVRAVYDNTTQINGFNKLNYSLEFRPSIPRLDVKPILNGQGALSLVDLNYQTRAAFSTNGDAVFISQGEGNITLLKNQAQLYYTQYAGTENAAVDQDQFTANDTGYLNMNFGFSWSFDSDVKLVPGGQDFKTINSFSVI